MKSVTAKCSRERVHCRDVGDCEEGDLDEVRRERVARIARRCPVHRTLESAPVIQDEVDLVRG